MNLPSQPSGDLANLFVFANQYFFGKHTDSFDILHCANLLAAKEAAEYYSEKMLTAKNFATNLDLLSHALKIRKDGGLVIEFGVATGNTVNFIADNVREKVYGFDVFSGLPETWRTGFEKGIFAQPIPTVRPNVELVVGYFEDTLPTFVQTHSGAFASFLHIDCDLYSATDTIFKHLHKMIVPDTVIVFDEYWNYPGWRQHEFKAFKEFCEFSKATYSYEAFVSRHQQVCVVITSIL